MITKCMQQDQDRIISYIGNDYPLCLYLYLDLKKYGFNSDTSKVYIQHNGNNIESILLVYYSCLHVFSKNNIFNVDELVTFFFENGISMIYCISKTAELIYSAFPKQFTEKTKVTNGWVAQIKKIDKEPQGMAVLAKKSDFVQIVNLIYEDEDIGRSYKYDELAKQLEERNKEGYSRNIVIKQDGLVLAHACTNAEYENIAVVAELLVRNGYRRKGYASEIWRDICGKLLQEGKEVYSFYYSEESRRLHKKIGFFEVCEWTKVVIV